MYCRSKDYFAIVMTSTQFNQTTRFTHPKTSQFWTMWAQPYLTQPNQIKTQKINLPRRNLQLFWNPFVLFESFQWHARRLPPPTFWCDRLKFSGIQNPSCPVDLSCLEKCKQICKQMERKVNKTAIGKTKTNKQTGWTRIIIKMYIGMYVSNSDDMIN